MLLVVRFCVGMFLVFMANCASARDVYVLIIGEPSAWSCQFNDHESMSGLFQLDMTGTERPMADPLGRSDCHAGQVWMLLASLLKKQAGARKVVLMPVISANAKLADWTNGTLASRLNAALDVANARGIHFDYAIWQQGEIKPAGSNVHDVNQLLSIIKNITIRAKIGKWLIEDSEASNASVSEGGNKAAAQFKEDVLRRRYRGPSDVGLSAAERLTDGQLTAVGQKKMAQRWFDALQRADKLNNHYEKESLLRFFR